MSEAMEGPVWCKRAQVSSQWHAFECGPVQFTLVQEKKSQSPLGEISAHLLCGDLSPMATWHCLNRCLAAPQPGTVPGTTVPGTVTGKGTATGTSTGTVTGTVTGAGPGECREMPVSVQGIKRRDFLHMSTRGFRRKNPRRAILVTARATDRLTRGSQPCALPRPSPTGGVGPGGEPGASSGVRPRRQTGGTPRPKPWAQEREYHDRSDTSIKRLTEMCTRRPESEGSLLMPGEPRRCPDPTSSGDSSLGYEDPRESGRPAVRQRLGREWKQPGLGLGPALRPGAGGRHRPRPRQGNPGGLRVRAHSAFPGVPWVSVTVEQRATHSLSSVPHSTSCFLVPQTLPAGAPRLTSAGPRMTSAGARDVSDANAGGLPARAYCLGIDTWRPVLQLRLPPATARKPRSSSRLQYTGSPGPHSNPSGVLASLRQQAATVCSPVQSLLSRLLGPVVGAINSRNQGRSDQQQAGQGGGGLGRDRGKASVSGYQGAKSGLRPGLGEGAAEWGPLECERLGPLKSLCVPRRARPALFSSARASHPHQHLRQNPKQHGQQNGQQRRNGAPGKAQGGRGLPPGETPRHVAGGWQDLEREQRQQQQYQEERGGAGVLQVGGFVREIAPAASHRVLQLWRRLCGPFAPRLQRPRPQGPTVPAPPLHPLASRLSSSSTASLAASHFPPPWGSPSPAGSAAAHQAAALHLALRLLRELGAALGRLPQSRGVVLAAKMREVALRGEMAAARLAGLEALGGGGRAGAGEAVAPAFSPPVRGGWLSSHYGWRGKRFHHGIDIAVEENTDITAAAPGIVAYVGWRGGYGKVVHLDHGNGFMTLYAHCNRFLVKPGQAVKGSDRIALSGNTGHSTGPHLHFEIQRNGGTLDPLWLLPSSYVHRLVPGR